MEEFYYKVNDDCMSGDRILRNDIVLVCQTQNVAPDDIAVIARKDDISMLILRRVEMLGSTYKLTPSNPDMKPEICDVILLVGKVTRTNVSA